MKVDDKLVERLAHLSRLEFDSKSKVKMKSDFEKILGFVDKLENVDTSSTEPLVYMSEEINVLRKDVVKGQVSQESALKKSKKEMTNIDEMNACSTCGKVGHSADHHKQDHEGKMAKAQLERSMKYAKMIYKIVDNVGNGGEVEMPAWVQSKLTKSMDYLQSVYNYLDGKDGLEDKFQKENSKK